MSCPHVASPRSSSRGAWRRPWPGPAWVSPPRMGLLETELSWPVRLWEKALHYNPPSPTHKFHYKKMTLHTWTAQAEPRIRTISFMLLHILYQTAQSAVFFWHPLGSMAALQRTVSRCVMGATQKVSWGAVHAGHGAEPSSSTTAALPLFSRFTRHRRQEDN